MVRKHRKKAKKVAMLPRFVYFVKYAVFFCEIATTMPNNTVEYTEWLLLRRCNLSNIGGRVYVRVRVSVRVIFQHYLAPPGHGHLCLTGFSVVTIATARNITQTGTSNRTIQM